MAKGFSLSLQNREYNVEYRNEGREVTPVEFFCRRFLFSKTLPFIFYTSSPFRAQTLPRATLSTSTSCTLTTPRPPPAASADHAPG